MSGCYRSLKVGNAKSTETTDFGRHLSIYERAMCVNRSAALSGLLLLWLLMSAGLGNAQVRTKRFGQPQNLESHGLMGAKQQLIPTLGLPAVDAAPLLAQDEQEAKNGMPFRFGINRDVSIDLIKVSAKGQQDGYRVYEYRIDAEGAFSLNLIFDRFRLKGGARLFLYNGDRTMIVGPITEAQNPVSGNPAGGSPARGNPAGGEFWTDLVQGSTLTIELQEPISGGGVSELNLRSVVHGYKNTFPDKLFGQAGACHPNMVCYPGYQFEGDGVAMILLAGGTRLCTGSMVNSMRQTFRSFFLSAFHCVDLDNSRTADAAEIAQAENWLVRFNYQSPTCTPTQEDADVITLNGTTFRAGYANSDVVLVELTQQVPPDVNTTYNGWNRGEATTSNNFSIHHPRGDVKKISFTNANTQISGYGGASGSTHLISFWGGLGVTDPGSSGSPLFDGNRRIVGQLQGGPSFCGATGTGLRDYYGRVFTSWTGGGTNNTRLSNWLDPDNNSNTTMDGAKPALSGPAAFSGSGTFSLNTLNSSAVSWSVAGGAGQVSPTAGVGNSANLLALGNSSSLTITFSVNDGQAYPILFSREFSISVPGSPTSGAGLSLLTPTYDCATGAIVFNTSGGDGTPITYFAVGVQRAGATSNSGTVESGLRADPKPLVISATQSGTTISQTFNFAAFCSSPPSPTVGTPPSPTTATGGSLSLLTPSYECLTGAIVFNTAGGDGSPIIYSAVGVQRAVITSNIGTVEAGLRADPKFLVITATQNGITVSQTFDFAAFCASARLARTEPEAGLQVRVLGNPTNGATVWAEISGVEGQLVKWRILDATGRQQSERQLDKAARVDMVQLPLGWSAGVYVLDVQSAGQRRTARILKVE